MARLKPLQPALPRAASGQRSRPRLGWRSPGAGLTPGRPAGQQPRSSFPCTKAQPGPAEQRELFVPVQGENTGPSQVPPHLAGANPAAAQARARADSGAKPCTVQWWGAMQCRHWGSAPTKAAREALPAPCPGRANWIPACGTRHGTGTGQLPAPSLPYRLRLPLRPRHVLRVTQQHCGSCHSHRSLVTAQGEHAAIRGRAGAGAGCSGGLSRSAAKRRTAEHSSAYQHPPKHPARGR